MSRTTTEALLLDEALGHRSSPQPRGAGGRRRNPRPVNRPLFHLTHLILGSAIGSLVGYHGYLIARLLFGAKSAILGHLWWLTIGCGIGAMIFIKSQMDSIRETVYVKRIEGKLKQIRVRRRHEVVMTLVKRAAIGLLAACAIIALLHYGILHFRSEIRGLGSGQLIPTVGEDVFMALFALLMTSVTLAFCELTLRATQKEGFPYIALWLFIPASVLSGITVLHLSSYIP